jgi:predicted naringenin-chalcone synthase
MRHSAYLTKIGTAVPKFQYSQLELADWMADRLGADEAMQRKLKVLYKMTRIESRHSVLPDFSPDTKDHQLFFNHGSPEPSVEKRMAIYRDAVYDLSLAAIKNTIDNEAELGSFTHLITVSCTGLSAPGLELKLKEELPFSEDLQTHAVNFVGCYAFFPALKMAEAFCKSEPESKVLIVATEICTIHFQNSDSEDHLLSNSLFADGAAACIVQGSEVEREHSFALELEHSTQMHFPEGKQDMAWDIDSSGFLMKLSAYVPDLLNKGIGELVRRLKQKSHSDQQIDHWAIHPGGRRILEVCAKELELDPDDLKASYEVLRKVGNLSAPTILFVIQEMWDKAADGEHLFACGFGPGLTLDGALFKWINNA